jgi:hypothetical protein
MSKWAPRGSRTIVDPGALFSWLSFRMKALSPYNPIKLISFCPFHLIAYDEFPSCTGLWLKEEKVPLADH